MLISTKGRYALRLMIYIAQASEDGTLALRKVATAEGLSQKYLEQLAHDLVKAGQLKSVRGRDGGYRLAVGPEDITAGDVLRAVEGDTTPVACAAIENGCPRENICTTVEFWMGLDKVIDDYVDSVTLADLTGKGKPLRPFQTFAIHGKQ